MMMYDNDYDDGDLMSIVRSCSRTKRNEMIASTLSPTALDPFSYLPPPPLPPPPQIPTRMEERLPENFTDLFSMNKSMSGGLEDIVMPNFPWPQSHQQQTGLFPSSAIGIDACPVTMRISEPSQMQVPSKQLQKPQAVVSYRKGKDKKKMVFMQNSIIVSNDNWAWCKYGEKPIQKCSYRRSYYKCSTCKSCPARKAVDKSQMEPKTFTITYTAEHNHPLPTHCDSAAGTIHVKCSASSSGSRKAMGIEASSSTIDPLKAASSLMEEDNKKMVFMQNSIIVSNDNWAWRKYGEMTIKNCSYRRSYYKCSTCMSCPARKTVDKSQMEPKTFIITYTAEHNHPLPTHCDSAAGTIHIKCSASSSGSRKAMGAEASFSTTDPPKTASSSLMEVDKKIVGEDELLFLGVDTILKTPVATGYSSFFDYVEDPFLSDSSNICFGLNN